MLRSLLTQVDNDFLDLAGKLERHVVILAYGRAGVFSDIEGFIDRETNWNCSVDPPLRDLFAVDTNRAGPTSAEAAAIVFKVEDNRVLTGRYRILSRDLVVRNV